MKESNNRKESFLKKLIAPRMKLPHHPDSQPGTGRALKATLGPTHFTDNVAACFLRADELGCDRANEQI